MTEAAFIAHNEEKWKTLETYNQRLVQSGIKKLSQAEVRAFAGLFRLAGYHLAYAKTHYPDGPAVTYLNQIVGVAHNFFYVRETGEWADIKRYFADSFPRAVRAASRYFFVSTALFLFGMLFAGFYVAADITRFAQIFPGDLLGGGFDGATGPQNWDYPLMSAVIMTNNIRVAFFAFALGITAGIGTVITLLYNGVVVGGLTGYVAQGNGDMLAFLSLILPHGILELTAIFLSGACGLMIGRALLIPGPHTRLHAVTKSAREAAVLIPGIVVMLILAGLIEGFFTPLAISPALKLAFAGATLAGLLVYIVREKRRY